MALSLTGSRVAELDRLLAEELEDEKEIAEIRNRIERRRVQRELMYKDGWDLDGTSAQRRIQYLSRVFQEQTGRQKSPDMQAAYISGLDHTSRVDVLRGKLLLRYVVQGTFTNMPPWKDDHLHTWEPEDPGSLLSANEKVRSIREEILNKLRDKGGAVTEEVHIDNGMEHYLFTRWSAEGSVWVSRELIPLAKAEVPTEKE